MKKVKCRYSNCLHTDKYLDKSDAVMGGNRSYYHPDCYKEKQTIENIIEYCISVITNYISRKKITEVVDDIISNKNVSAEELYFKIKKYIQLGKPLNYPNGIYYIIKDADVNKEYISYRNKQIINADTSDVELVENTTFNYVCPKRKSIVDVLL